jgi:hypothetical protein
MLDEERVDQPRRFSARLANDRKDVLLLEQLLVIALAERLEEPGGVAQRGCVDRCGIGEELRRRLLPFQGLPAPQVRNAPVKNPVRDEPARTLCVKSLAVDREDQTGAMTRGERSRGAKR